jgi:hypothetical protein
VRIRVAFALAAGVLAGVALAATTSVLAWWCLVLTGAQAAVHIACSRDKANGWMAGLALQPPWIIYSVLTHQLAFIITAVMIASGNLLALRRLDPRAVRAAPRDKAVLTVAPGMPAVGGEAPADVAHPAATTTAALVA